MSMDPDPTRSYLEQPQEAAQPAGSSPPAGPAGPTNGFAIASLVLGIIGLMGFPPLIPSILGLVFGYKAKNEIDRSNGYEQGRGLAVAGIVLGWIAIAMVVLVIAFFAVTAVGLGVFSELGP
jgi:hypothetical protein